MVIAAATPFILVIFLQLGQAGLSIIAKFALNQGMDQHVFIVYRHIFACASIAPFALIFERKKWPKMTAHIVVNIMVLGLLEPVIDQTMYYTGMKYTSATFTAAMCNVLPAFAFVLAWICRLEKVDVRKVHSQAKILGTVVTVAGAMVMTLVKGAVIGLPWTKSTASSGESQTSAAAASSNNPIKGAVLIVSGCLCWACFIVLQAITLKSYPAELSLTALICFAGAVEGLIVAIVFQRGINAAPWILHFDIVLLTIVYSGVICSGVTYYIQSKIMQTRGPVFVSAFSPITMVIVAILGSLFLHEIIYLGRLFGALIIVVGLYLVLWGKSKDQKNDESTNGSVEMHSFVTVDISKVRPDNEASCVI